MRGDGKKRMLNWLPGHCLNNSRLYLKERSPLTPVVTQGEGLLLDNSVNMAFFLYLSHPLSPLSLSSSVS